jgi:hypothetical protein
MQIAEPTTLLTDYLIAAESALFALLIWRKSPLPLPLNLWAAAFLGVAIAAFLAGTCHGFTFDLSHSMLRLLWQTMLASLGIASSLMLTAAILLTLQHPWRRWGTLAVLFKTVALLVWAIPRTSFIAMVLDYMVALFLGVILYWRNSPKLPSTRWLMAGFTVSLLGATVQILTVSPAPWFNQNDLYHVIQMVALYLLFRGAIASKRTTA